MYATKACYNKRRIPRLELVDVISIIRHAEGTAYLKIPHT